MTSKLSQQTIKNLVIEASSPTCLKERREEIRGELVRAVHVPSGKYTGSSDGSYTCLTRTLFIQTVEADPEKLTSLLPFFLMMCGNGEYDTKDIFAKIDWSLVD